MLCHQPECDEREPRVERRRLAVVRHQQRGLRARASAPKASVLHVPSLPPWALSQWISRCDQIRQPPASTGSARTRVCRGEDGLEVGVVSRRRCIRVRASVVRVARGRDGIHAARLRVGARESDGDGASLGQASSVKARLLLPPGRSRRIGRPWPPGLTLPTSTSWQSSTPSTGARWVDSAATASHGSSKTIRKAGGKPSVARWSMARAKEVSCSAVPPAAVPVETPSAAPSSLPRTSPHTMPWRQQRSLQACDGGPTALPAAW